MPGKKGKEKRRSTEAKGDPGLAGLLGFSGMTDVSEEDLEAELLALTGEGGRKKHAEGKPKQMSMAEIDALVAGIGDVEGDMSGSDEEIDDEELLAELKELEGEEAEADVEVKPKKAKTTTGGVSADVQKIQAREKMYQDALTLAMEKGESGKVRRFERALHTIGRMSKDAMAGKAVDWDDLPPQVSVAPVGRHGVPDDQHQVRHQRTEHNQNPQESPGHDPPERTIGSPLVTDIQQRLKMYQEVVKETENLAKVKRYNRAIASMQQMLQDAKLGKKVHMDMLPPEISVSSKHVVKEQSSQLSRGNLIDLDAPEFDEFNISEEDMAALAASLVDDRHSKVESKKSPSSMQAGSSPLTSPLPSNQQAVKVPPKSAVPVRPTGLIDLDTPEFSEFDISDADMEALAATIVDDRVQKKKISSPPTTPVGRGHALPVNAQQQPPVQVPPSKELVRAVLCERKQQYSDAMHKAKASGDADATKRLAKIAVQFNKSIKALDQGVNLDLSIVPPPPPGYQTKYSEINLSLFSSNVSHPPTSSNQVPTTSLVETQTSDSLGQDEVDPSIRTPTSVLEALQQRLEKYQEGQKTATEKGESSRIRRMGRIIKAYENSIKLTKAGKPVDYSELPTPPGFPPIPTGQTSVTQSVPATARKPMPSSSLMPSTQSLPAKTVAQKITSSVSDQQLQLLLSRSAEFQHAARASKTSGDKENALKYMRLYKSMQQMILAARGGLPVNMAQVPQSPYADTSKTKPSNAVLAHLKPATEGDSTTFDLIEQQLQQQIDVCNSNATTYEGLGNLPAMTQYRNMAEQCQRDLLAIKGIRSQNLGPPKFTMEMRKFAIINSNPDVSDKRIEVTILKGIAIPAPAKDYAEDDLNLYVEVEFPWPQDNPQKCQTDAVRGSSSPQYDKKCLFDIDRKQSRSLLRTFKRHRVKCQVYQHRTIRKDIFIGQANISLEELENRCEVHISEDLKDERGRKAIGGRLEVLIRLREPLTGRDQQEKEQKWLVFQESIASEPTIQMPVPAATSQSNTISPVEVDNTTSVDALKLEFGLVQNALKSGQKNQVLVQRGRQIQSRLQAIQQRLRQDPSYNREYIQQVSREMQREKVLEQQLAKAGRNAEVKIIQGRRRVMESEMSKWGKK